MASTGPKPARTALEPSTGRLRGRLALSATVLAVVVAVVLLMVR